MLTAIVNDYLIFQDFFLFFFPGRLMAPAGGAPGLDFQWFTLARAPSSARAKVLGFTVLG